jgi:hypothetical protein
VTRVRRSIQGQGTRSSREALHDLVEALADSRLQVAEALLEAVVTGASALALEEALDAYEARRLEEERLVGELERGSDDLEPCVLDQP